MDTKNGFEARVRKRRRKDRKNIFFPKVRSYDEGKGTGESTHLKNLPKIREHLDRMYEWIMVLTAFIDKMMHKPSKEMRNKRIKFVIYAAAG